MDETDDLIDEYVRTLHELEESLQDKQFEIKEKDHQIAVLEMALELACEELSDMDISEMSWRIDYYKQQAEKEIGGK